MKMKIRTKSNQAGYVLPVVTIFIFTMGIVGAAFFSMAGHETLASQATLNSHRAFWLAEGSKALAMLYLSELYSPPTSDITIFNNVAGPDGGTYTVTCAVDTSVVWDAEKGFVLDCVGNVGGVERRVRQRVRMTSFSLYAMFTNQEKTEGGYTIWHFTGGVVDGPLHSNGSLSIYGTPSFLGPVTSASDHMTGYRNYWIDEMSDWPVAGNNPYFAEGAELNVDVIPMPSETVDLKNLGQYGGVYTAPTTNVQLGVRGIDSPVTAPGWFRYREHNTSDDWTSVNISGMSNKVFYCNDKVYLEGVLDGELTISSRQSICIVDDVTYAGSDSSGQPLVGCDDLLGLVAEDDIVFVDNSANQNDLIVNGVLMALDTSIKVQNYDEGSPRGTLTIWGGLIQQVRGAVGQASDGYIIHGYQKEYHYDHRVTARTPPYFPQTGIYEELAWEETWDATYPF